MTRLASHAMERADFSGLFRTVVSSAVAYAAP